MLLLSIVISGITDGATLGLMALGIVLVYKATRVINFAQGEIGTFSIYVAWVASSPFARELSKFDVPFTGWSIPVYGLGLTILLAAPLALVVAAGMGAAMERIVIRPMSDAAPLTITVATLGVSTVLGGMEFIIFGERPQNLPAIVSGSGLRLFDFYVQPGRLLALLVTVGLGVALYFFFKRTTFGLGVLAASQNPTSLRLMGIKLSLVSLFTWASAAVLAAMSGIVLAPTIGAFHPFFMTLLLIPSFAAALVGGLTSLPGAFVGGLIVGVVTNVSRYLWGDQLSGVEYVAIFALIVIVLLVRPRGLLGAEA